MPFISRQRLEELKYAERQLEQFDEESHKANVDFTKALNKQVRNLREEHEDELDDLRHEQKLERREYEEEADRLVDEANARADKAVAAQKKAETERDAIKAVADKESDLVKREVKIETREAKLDSREELLIDRETNLEKAEKDFNKKVTEHAEEVAKAKEEAFESGVKKGYAEGSADMARTIGDLTKDAQDKAHALADKAMDGIIEAVAKETPQPTVNVIPVPAAGQAAAKK